jgi:hypothetical protein
MTPRSPFGSNMRQDPAGRALCTSWWRATIEREKTQSATATIVAPIAAMPPVLRVSGARQSRHVAQFGAKTRHRSQSSAPQTTHVTVASASAWRSHGNGGRTLR